MNIINITLGVDTQPCSAITLGRRGENEVTQVVVDFSSWVEEFGAGVITLLAMRSQDTSAYPVVLTLANNTATWDVTSTDTAYKGSGRAEYIYTVGEQIAKSVVFNTVVMQDIGEPSETPPDPYEDWLERLTELGAETQANAEAAQQSAEDAAQSAQEAAESAASVEGSVEQAEAARDAARAAQAASEAARDAAQTAQASAESSATSASGSATSAAGSATSAAGSSFDASSSASAASASATTASTAATAAQTAQSAAEDAAEDAQQAAQQAHVEYEQLSDAVDDLSDEVTQQKSAIEALDSLVDRKAGMLVDTASGAIASFVPDSTIPDLLGVAVAVEPVQDLHGYDSPWPAGGGVNIMDDAYSSSYTNEIVLTEGTYYAQAWLTQNPSQHTTNPALLIDGAWTNITPPYSGDGISIAGTSFGWLWSDATQTITVSAGKTYTIRYNRNDAAMQTRRLTFSKTQLTAFSPYSNICPISGWNSVDIMHSGADTSNPTTYTITLGQTVYGGTLDATAGTLTVDRPDQNVSAFIGEYGDASPSGWRRFRFNTTAPVPFVDHSHVIGAICDKLQEMNANALAALVNNGTITAPAFSAVSATQICVALPVTTLADANAYLTSLGGLQFVYPLATSITITLDPVTISTISGQPNNVWADAGDVAVEYAADIKAYIDRLNQPAEDDMIANSLIAANKYFTINNRLFLSTASIAAGAQIIPGHNCTETNLAAALNALNA